MFSANKVEIKSRGVEIPGGFAQMTEILAKSGIASIRVDFPGCGDSQVKKVAIF